MGLLSLNNCLPRQIHNTENDLGMQISHTSHQRNTSESDGPGSSFIATVESTNLEGDSNVNSRSMTSNHGYFLGIFLSFYYYIGVSPFRVDGARNVRACWISKLLSILIFVLAVIYIIFNIRRHAFQIDTKDNEPHVGVTSYIGLVYQSCLMFLHTCVFGMMWRKQVSFQKLFLFLDGSEISETLRSTLANVVAISVCVFTVLTSLICTFGGLAIMDRCRKWSFGAILEHHEAKFFLGLKNYYDDDATDLNLNGTSGSVTNTTDDDDYSGIFLSDGDLETVIFGGAGILVDVCQHIFSSYSQDCFLLSAITLWMCTTILRNQLKVWENRVSTLDSDCEFGGRSIADDIVTKYKELGFLSKTLNAITNSILPAMIMANIIQMAYFIHCLVSRQWYFALYLSLKLFKVWTATYFAMKTSKVAEKYYTWFISEDVQEALTLSSKQLHRKFWELKDSPLGIGSSVFYIDTRFLLSALGIVSTYFYMVTGIGT